MVWAKFDDRYPTNRKIRKCSDAAYRLDTSAIMWSCGELTDGHIPPDDLDIVSDVKKPTDAAAELVRRDRWHLPGHDCKSEHCYPIDDGWLIHDFHDFNPRSVDVERKREVRRLAGSKGGKSSSQRRAGGEANG
jgi:hypothetical protein